MNKKAALIILDGWGHDHDPARSAIAKAKTPFVDRLYKSLPNTELVTYGEEVGLPEGQMGNSEVGHLNIGAGRVVYQAFAKINKSIREGEINKNPQLLDAIKYAKENNKAFHLMGLVSDGGVHSHISHLIYLCKILSEHKIQVKIHAFLDGRDTAPNGGAKYLKEVQANIDLEYCKIVSVIGRYYAMDRDNRWERIAKAYQLMVHGIGKSSSNLIQSITESYANGITDEFMDAHITENHTKDDLIKDEDVVLFYNFRTDRPRQLTIALTQENHKEEGMEKLNLHFYTMTEYSKSYKGLHVLYKKEDLINTLGEVISANNRTQVRIAETEKYPHVTFFFSGGREDEYSGESRILVNSPKVATYDLAPEMSAIEVTDSLIAFVEKETPDFICLNYANVDMVGHTGDMSAAAKSVETVDKCLSRLIPVLDLHNYSYIIIADHGNADIMLNVDGTVHTAHTTNPVPCFVGGNGIDKLHTYLKPGKLGDIAPSILKLMDIPVPKEMTGNNLVFRK